MSIGQGVKAKRNPSIEVMRCLLMFFIVLYHGCNNKPDSVVCANSVVKLIPWFLFFCTNSFMFISGWFGIRFSWGRVLRFLGMGAFAAVVLGLASKSVLGSWHWQLSLGWFGTSYLAVMLLAPIVNSGLETLAKDSRRSLLLAWSAFASAVFVSWLPLGLKIPGWCGHGFSTMLFIYVSARVIRLAELETRISSRMAALIFFVALGIHLARLVPIVLYPSVKDLFILTADYDAPEVLVMGAAFFLMLYRVRFPNWLNASCVLLAPSMFVVYLLHEGGSVVGPRFYDQLVLFLFNQMPIGGAFGCVFAIALGATTLFFTCCGIDAFRRIAFRMCIRKA